MSEARIVSVKFTCERCKHVIEDDWQEALRHYDDCESAG